MHVLAYLQPAVHPGSAVGDMLAVVEGMLVVVGKFAVAEDALASGGGLVQAADTQLQGRQPAVD